MAEKLVQNTKYTYGLNASLVIQGNQGGGAPRQDNEPTGEGSTLAGRQLAAFGDRTQQTKPTELKERVQKQKQKQQKAKERDLLKKRGKTKSDKLQSSQTQNVVNVEIGEELLYRPKTRETKAYYE